MIKTTINNEKLDKVLKGLDVCLKGSLSRCHGNSNCPYCIWDNKHPTVGCEYHRMIEDAFDILKELRMCIK